MREVYSVKVNLPKQLEIMVRLCCPHPSFEMVSRQVSSAPLIRILVSNTHLQLLECYSTGWPGLFP